MFLSLISITLLIYCQFIGNYPIYPFLIGFYTCFGIFVFVLNLERYFIPNINKKKIKKVISKIFENISKLGKKNVTQKNQEEIKIIKNKNYFNSSIEHIDKKRIRYYDIRNKSLIILSSKMETCKVELILVNDDSRFGYEKMTNLMRMIYFNQEKFFDKNKILYQIYFVDLKNCKINFESLKKKILNELK